MNKRILKSRARRTILLMLCAAMTVLFVCPVPGRARETGKTVRVGWYESSFNTTDTAGRRSGYAYEYQQKVAAYTGWRYEYVHGSWSTLMQMLLDGEIDLMSDVSYTPERAEKMQFASLPMGTEEYYLVVAPENQAITPENPSSVNGKKIAVNQGSIQLDYYRAWAEQRGIQSEIIEVNGTENDSLQMLERGELDAYVTVDSFTDTTRAVPVFKIGSSDFFFALRKDRPDLLRDLNAAMSRIQDENRYYNQRLFEKYFRRTGANAFLSTEEVTWLQDHNPIRVGYLDNYMAFCDRDDTTGELTGALKDYLLSASECMVNAELSFEPIAFPTVATTLDALQAGEVDCVFPANLSSYDGEIIDAIITPPITQAKVYAVVRRTDQKIFSDKEHVIVAVSEGNPNYDTFLMEHYPEWHKIYYPTTEDCLKAVGDSVADCTLINYYRYTNISRLCDKYHLNAFSTGIGMDYSFAVHNGDTELYSILSKAVVRVSDTVLNTALSNYITEDARLTLGDYLTDHLAAVMVLIIGIVLIILVLMVKSMRAEWRAKNLISATENDDLTGLYNRNYFFQYAYRNYRAYPDRPMDAIVLNIEQFHSVNALNGRAFGDKVLYTLGDAIRGIVNDLGGIAGRFEADRFDIYCPHTDDYQAIFNRLQDRLDKLSPNSSLQLRMGVMPWQANLEPVQQFDRARTACSMARGHYKERLIIYDQHIGDLEVHDQRLLNDLRVALDNYEFDVYYQPKFDIQANPPRPVSAEALVRWNHHELGMIPPGDFIPLFERSGRIGEIDKYVWSQAARQINRWRDQYGVTVPVSVNLSRVDVFDPTLEKTLEEILMYNGLEHATLKLEVTESAYTENAEQVIQVVESLRKRGYEIEMDDFGTGYSSLNMLSSMPVDVLKLDRAFIMNMEHDKRDVQLVALILDIARNLKIPVIAEGVETEEQMTILKDLGCAYVQGYYFSRPLSSADFEKKIIRKMRPAL